MTASHWAKPGKQAVASVSVPGNRSRGVLFIQRGAERRRKLAREKALLVQMELGMVQPMRLVKP